MTGTQRVLGQRAVAEAVGTGFLVAAVIGSGIAAGRLAPGQPGLQLLINSLATGAALAALIVALQPVSAAFNPLVTVVERILGVLCTRDTIVLIAAQLSGGVVGAAVANLMFGLPAISWSQQQRTGGGLLLGEVVATLGLLVIVVGAAHGGRERHIGYLVGAYVTAAYWFTSSTSFANPAVTLARTLTDSFAGITPTSTPAFLLAQLVGAALALFLIMTLFGGLSPTIAKRLGASETELESETSP